jgi:hypothetical protein
MLAGTIRRGARFVKGIAPATPRRFGISSANSGLLDSPALPSSPARARNSPPKNLRHTPHTKFRVEFAQDCTAVQACFKINSLRVREHFAGTAVFSQCTGSDLMVNLG